LVPLSHVQTRCATRVCSVTRATASRLTGQHRRGGPSRASCGPCAASSRSDSARTGFETMSQKRKSARHRRKSQSDTADCLHTDVRKDACIVLRENVTARVVLGVLVSKGCTRQQSSLHTYLCLVRKRLFFWFCCESS
jgi:hypothetical protein